MAVYGLNGMTDRILEEARAEAARILDDARAECEEIASGYAARAERIRDRISIEAERKGSDMIVRAKASSSIRKQELLKEKRASLLDGLFADVRASLPTQKGDGYRELLCGLLSAALTELRNAERRALTEGSDEPILVQFCQRDLDACAEQVLADARKKQESRLSGDFLARVRLCEEAFDGDGGVRVTCGDATYDDSLEAIFARLRVDLEREVSDALFLERKFRT